MEETNSTGSSRSSKVIQLLVLFCIFNSILFYFYSNGVSNGKLLIFEAALWFFLIKGYYNKDKPTENRQISTSSPVSGFGVVGGLLLLVFCNAVLYVFTHTAQYLFIFDFIIICGTLIWLSYKVKQEEQVLMREAAVALQYSFSPKGDPSTLNGSVFGFGHSRKVENVFTGSFQGYPVSIFDYYFQKGFGKGSMSFGFTFFELTLAAKFPAMVISSQEAAVTSIQSVESDLIADGETVALEGDFSKFFSTRVEVGHQMESREILTPDIMAHLIDQTPSYSFIFSNEKVYICFKNFYAASDAPSSFSKEAFFKDIQSSQVLITKWLPTLIRG